MDPVASAALAGLMLVATDAAKETASKLATSAWGKIKAKLGWSNDVPAAEIEAKVAPVLAAAPELAKEIQCIVNDYRTQVGSVSVGTLGSMNLGDAMVGTVKQVSVGQNSGTINL